MFFRSSTGRAKSDLVDEPQCGRRRYWRFGWRVGGFDVQSLARSSCATPTASPQQTRHPTTLGGIT
jgi:hypothetical protein